MNKFDPTDLARWSEGEWCNGVPDVINGIVHDSRTTKPGRLYVALRGENHDGHAFLSDARNAGAVAGLIDQRECLKTCKDLPLLCVKDTRRALLNMAAGHRSRLRGKIIGITGSAGKTSVKEMTADVLSLLGRTTRTFGNWNNDIGLPLSLLRMHTTDAFGVFEVGMNHPGELGPLCELLAPSCGIMTSIGPVHIEYFESVDAIAAEKAELLRSLDSSGMAVLGKDEKWYDYFRSQMHGRIISVSLREDADYRGVPDGPDRMRVYERGSRGAYVYDLPIPGKYAMDNALRAIAIGRQHGLPHEELIEAISSYRPAEMRWARTESGGIRFINDAYNSNPLSMRAALDAFAEMETEGRKWLVLAGMYELGAMEKQAHLDAGRDVARGTWEGVIVVGDLGSLIADGAEQAGFIGSIYRCDCSASAARKLHEHVVPGDAVLMKASRGERLEDVLKEYKLICSTNPRPMDGTCNVTGSK